MRRYRKTPIVGKFSAFLITTISYMPQVLYNGLNRLYDHISFDLFEKLLTCLIKYNPINMKFVLMLQLFAIALCGYLPDSRSNQCSLVRCNQCRAVVQGRLGTHNHRMFCGRYLQRQLCCKAMRANEYARMF